MTLRAVVLADVVEPVLVRAAVPQSDQAVARKDGHFMLAVAGQSIPGS
jgi:hypothetical protein